MSGRGGWIVAASVVFGFVAGNPGLPLVAQALTLAPATVVPVVLDAGSLQSQGCDVPGATPGNICAFYLDASDPGTSGFAFANLDLWSVPPDATCANAGASSRGEWVVNGYPDPLGLNGIPPGSDPTYVCYDSGHSSTDRSALATDEGVVKIFPANDCDGQVDATGAAAPCPLVPDKFDIVGFVPLLIEHVYSGDDPAAIGEPGEPPGACGTHSADPNSLCLVLSAAAARPDALVAQARGKSFIGDGVFGGEGAGQTVDAVMEVGRHHTFVVKVQNDGEVSDTFAVDGSHRGRGYRVRYVLPDGSDVTPAVVGGTYHITLGTGDGQRILIRIAVRRQPDQPSRTWLLAATSMLDPSAWDVVGAHVNVVTS